MDIKNLTIDDVGRRVGGLEMWDGCDRQPAAVGRRVGGLEIIMCHFPSME